VADEATETVKQDEDFAGILDGEQEQLRDHLGTPEPDAVTADEQALQARNKRAWVASEGHVLYNKHDADEWEARVNKLLGTINSLGRRIEMGNLHIASTATAMLDLLIAKGIVTEHEARAAKAHAAHDGLGQILIQIEAELDAQKATVAQAQAARQAQAGQLAVAERPPIFVPGRDG
jgi:hypothetical protein